jgi:hypothetical protein
MAILRIPITKAGNKPIEVDTELDLPDAMYALALEEGLKVLLNKGMSKITVAKLEGEDLAKAHEAAMTVAKTNFIKLKAGELRKGRATAISTDGKKVPGVVRTEARRIAKEVVKNAIRASGKKVSHVEASEITKVANELLEADPSYIETAKANIAARTAKVPAAENPEAAKAAALDFLGKLGGVHESPILVAKDEKAKAERKTSVSAKQSGKVAPRKPKAEVHA